MANKKTTDDIIMFENAFIKIILSMRYFLRTTRKPTTPALSRHMVDVLGISATKGMANAFVVIRIKIPAKKIKIFMVHFLNRKVF